MHSSDGFLQLPSLSHRIAFWGIYLAAVCCVLVQTPLFKGVIPSLLVALLSALFLSLIPYLVLKRWGVAGGVLTAGFIDLLWLLGST